MRETKWYRNLIIISCAAGIAMFWSFFFLYHTYIQIFRKAFMRNG